MAPANVASGPSFDKDRIALYESKFTPAVFFIALVAASGGLLFGEALRRRQPRAGHAALPLPRGRSGAAAPKWRAALLAGPRASERLRGCAGALPPAAPAPASRVRPASCARAPPGPVRQLPRPPPRPSPSPTRRPRPPSPHPRPAPSKGFDNGITGGVIAHQDFGPLFFPHIDHAASKDPFCKYDDHLLQLFTSSLFLAAGVAAMVGSWTCNRFGRKMTMLAGGVCFLVGTGLVAGAVHIAMLVCGRIVLGIGVGFACQVRGHRERGVCRLRGCGAQAQHLGAAACRGRRDRV
jgi:hypothetical protein